MLFYFQNYQEHVRIYFSMERCQSTGSYHKIGKGEYLSYQMQDSINLNNIGYKSS